MQISISIVLPSYNEARRLPDYLASLRSYLPEEFLSCYEVIVVDDGSQDETGKEVSDKVGDWPQLILLRHDTNRGKGQALRSGVAAARGDYILIADADGATPIAEEESLRRALRKGADVAIGSRFLGTKGVHRSPLRKFAGALFAWAVRRILGLQVRDSQCGFKMFRREVGQQLFGLCCETGYLIDLEVLMHARRLNVQVAELPVQWRDIPGSKVRLIPDGWKMLCGLWRLRRAAPVKGPRGPATAAALKPSHVGGPSAAGALPTGVARLGE